MEFRVSGAGSSPSAGVSVTILIGQVMKSEYRLTISLIFQGEA